MRRVLIIGSFPLIVIGIFIVWNLVHVSNTPDITTPHYELTPLPNPTEVSSTTTPNTSPATESTVIPLSQTYLEITDGCSISVNETCYKAYSKPNTDSAVRAQLRIGSVLLVKNSTSTGTTTWYEIDFQENLRYSDRLTLPWYVSADAGELIQMTGVQDFSSTTASTTKSLIVDRSDQKLYAYDGETLIRTYIISTGRNLTPTPRGIFQVYKMTPTRYMQGPIPGISTNYYDLPGVPWNLYFTTQGAVVHGAYWHNSFGIKYSNGCVNLPPQDAKELYLWAELGMPITVQD